MRNTGRVRSTVMCVQCLILFEQRLRTFICLLVRFVHYPISKWMNNNYAKWDEIASTSKNEKDEKKPRKL